MQKILSFFLLSLFLLPLTSLSAQNATDWIQWTMDYDATQVQKGKTLTVTFKAKVKEGYHVYSGMQPAKAVLPLKMNPDAKNTCVIFEPFTETGNRKVEFDDIFKADIAYYDKDFEVVQKIKIKKKKLPIKGYISYQVCNDEMCLPGDYHFEIK